MNTKEPLQHWEQLKKGIPWLGMIVLLLCFYFLPPSPPLMDANELTYSEFLNEVRAGHLEDVQIKEKIVTGYRKGQDNSLAARQHRFVSAARLPSLSETELVWELEAQHVRFSGSPEKGSDWLLILSMIALPLLLLASLYVSRLKRFGQSGALTFGKTHAKIYDQAKHLNVNFEDVAGVDEAKAELVEVVDFLKNAAQYQRLGGRIPRGVLLVGPPGTGKTCSRKRWRAKRVLPSFPSPDPSLWRCLWAWERPGSGTFSSKQRRRLPALFSSTSWMRWASHGRITASPRTRSASRRSTSC